MKPTIGRIVWFRPRADRAPGVEYGGEILPAIVVNVFGDGVTIESTCKSSRTTTGAFVGSTTCCRATNRDSGSGRRSNRRRPSADYKLAESQPSAVVEVVRGWGPLGVIGIVGMVLVDRRWAQSIEAHGKVAESQQVLAVAVQKIADKDDQRIREQELVLDHLSKTNEKIFTTLEAMRDALPPRAKAQGAGI
jgi:hypothetical protein